MLPIVLLPNSGTPLAAQIASSVRRLTADGALRGGDAVPSTRTLSQQLGVSRSTVVQAYDQLTSECYLVATPGGKTRIHPDAERIPAVRPETKTENGVAAPHMVAQRTAPLIDLTPRNVLSAPLDDSLWRESWRRAAAGSNEETPAQGMLSTRVAIAEHLRLLRRLSVRAEDIFLTGGAREGLQLLLAALDLPVVAVETPGYPGLRGVIRRSRSTPQDSPVNQWGLIPSGIPAGATAAVVTPNHLYPAGGSMPAPQRSELLSIAASRNILIIEDDLDSEFRHLGPVPPTLWELAPTTVIHLGTFNRVLTSEAKIGYLLAAPHLHGDLLNARKDLGPGTSVIAQRAVGNYLTVGGLRRHITRRRRDLTRRRVLVTENLHGFPLELQTGGSAIIRTANAEEILAECERRGVMVGSMKDYWHGQEEGIIFGYGTAPLESMKTALKEIAATLRGDNHES